MNENDELMQRLSEEADKKNLDMFIFEKDELKNYFEVRQNKDFALVTLAKNRECALWNIKNLRHTYIINDYESRYLKAE